MPNKSRNKSSYRWQGPDHHLAVATIALIAFLFITGTMAWLLGEQPVTAGAAPGGAHTSANR
jgi:hypothetical protein